MVRGFRKVLEECRAQPTLMTIHQVPGAAVFLAHPLGFNLESVELLAAELQGESLLGILNTD